MIQHMQYEDKKTKRKNCKLITYQSLHVRQDFDIINF